MSQTASPLPISGSNSWLSISCNCTGCAWTGSKNRFLEHFRLVHDPDDFPSHLKFELRPSQCPECRHWFQRLNQHLSKCKPYHELNKQQLTCQMPSVNRNTTSRRYNNGTGNSNIISGICSTQKPYDNESTISGRPSLPTCISNVTSSGNRNSTSGMSCLGTPTSVRCESLVPSMDSSHSSLFHLPPFKKCAATSFKWNDLDGSEACKELSRIYDNVVFWRKNLFLVPSGRVGKDFVSEMCNIFQAYSNATAMEVIALKAFVVLQVLLWQKPSAKSKSRDHVYHLQHRLNLWKEGRFDELFREGKAIQQRLESSKKPPSNQQIERIFSRLMVQGKVNAGLRYLSDNTNGGILAMDEIAEGSNGQTARNVLKEKHPASQPTSNSALLQQPVNDIPAVIFDQIDGDAIKRAALRTQGSSGPSGMDSNAWRRLCCSFGCQSAELCNSLASLAKRLCTQFVHPRGLKPLLHVD